MIAMQLDTDQMRAVEAPFDACVAITGAPGTGKSTALRARIERASVMLPDARPLVLDSQAAFHACAAGVLEMCGLQVRLVDDIDAEAMFESACSSLFAMEWDELVAHQLDPEVPGLRSPERFLESAFRLIRKLREARISPQEFLTRSLEGATAFYAKPPNFSDPALLYYTKGTYHDSLNVDAPELNRQYRREIDLAKILAKLYRDYTELTLARGALTGRDAVDTAVDRLIAQPSFGAHLRARHQLAFVDDAQGMTAGELQMLQTVFGTNLGGVTLCGDASSAVETFRSSRPEAAFEPAAVTIELTSEYRSPVAIDSACTALLPHKGMTPLQTHETPAQGELQLHRAQSQRDEAAFIAAQVRAWIDEGTPPQRIAVLFRSVRTIDAYAAALVDRDVPIVVGGDANVFADRRALDALALLWNVYDPFRHEWMLRTLENPGLGLSDSTLALLCAEPPSPQAPLFIHDDEPAPTVRSSRWDPKRDLRLGWNVVRGEQDAALAPIARERIERFRKLREGWIEALYVLPFEAFVRRVWSEGLASEGEAGSARERIQQTVLQMLMRRMLAYMEGRPDATIADVLEYAEHRSQSDLETCTPPPDCNDCVSVLSIEAAQGLQFDRVVVAGVRAGSFPLWYVPDSFLFSPRLGMVPKENAGDARAARTAKFSYYMFRTKAREGYNAQERRAFVYALRRARRSVLVTSWGNPTKGVTAPEFFEELRTAGIVGTDIV